MPPIKVEITTITLIATMAVRGSMPVTKVTTMAVAVRMVAVVMLCDIMKSRLITVREALPKRRSRYS